MPGGAMRKIRVDDDARPRDAAIRRDRDERLSGGLIASNDNAANDNDPAYPTVSDQFNASYGRQGLQPSVGGMMTYRNAKVEREQEREPNHLRQVGGAVKNTGRVAQATGAGLKGTGTVLRGAGAVTTRAGAALSGTGVGAIVGVPLVAIGATLSATGTASRIAGQVSSQTGKQAVRTGKGINRVARAKEAFAKAPSPLGGKKALTKAIPGGARILAVRATIMNISWATWVYVVLQLPLAILAIIALAVAAGWEEVQNGDGGFIDSAIGYLASAANAVVAFFTGFSLDQFTSLFILANGFVWLLGLAVMLIMGIVYMLNGVHCLFGKGAGLKIGFFLLALVGYFIPILNLFPWAIVWVLAVIMNPE